MSALIKPVPEANIVLTKALLRAVERLNISNSQLARVLGVNASTITRYNKGTSVLNANGGEWDSAAAVIKIYRSLAGLLDGNDALIVKWMTSTNSDFGCTPIEILNTGGGVYRLGAYLDAYRGRF